MQKEDGHSAERSKVKQCLLPAPDFSLEKLAKSSRDRLFFAHICHRRTLPRSGRRVTLSFISGLTTTRCIAEETMKVALGRGVGTCQFVPRSSRCDVTVVDVK